MYFKIFKVLSILSLIFSFSIVFSPKVLAVPGTGFGYVYYEYPNGARFYANDIIVYKTGRDNTGLTTSRTATNQSNNLYGYYIFSNTMDSVSVAHQNFDCITDEMTWCKSDGEVSGTVVSKLPKCNGNYLQVSAACGLNCGLNPHKLWINADSIPLPKGWVIDTQKSILTINDVRINNNANKSVGDFVIYLMPEIVANNPPVCSGLQISPAQKYYLPNELITLTAKATDPEGARLTYNNWWVEPSRNGAFESSLNSDTVKYRTTSLPNSTETVVFNVTDGTTDTACKYNISTQVLYSCDPNSFTCVANSQKGLTSVETCNAGCKKTYNCDSSLGCVAVLNDGEFATSESCESVCSAKTIDCASITQQLLNNDTYSISARLISNFYNKTVLLKWLDAVSNTVISSESITLPSSYYEFTKSLSYSPPRSSATQIKLNIDNKDVCETTLQPQNGQGQIDLSLNFIDESGNTSPTYTISQGEQRNTTLKLDYTIPDETRLDSYYLTLSCTGLSCAFDNGTKQMVVTNLMGSGSITTNVSFTGISEGVFTINGYGAGVSGSYPKSASAGVTVISKPNLNLKVYKSNRVLSSGETLSSFCADTSNSISGSEKADFDLKNLTLDTDQKISYPGAYPIPIFLSSYALSKSNLYSLESYEIKCINYSVKDATNKTIKSDAVYGSPSVAFNLESSEPPYAKSVDVNVVLGLSTEDSWFRANGGSAFSFLSIKNNVPDQADSYFLKSLSSPTVSAGVSASRSFENAQEKNISEKGKILYKNSNSIPSFKFLNGLQLGFENVSSRSNKIDNISKLSFSQNTKLFVYDKDLNIDGDDLESLNSKYSANSKNAPQILVVKGAVKISIDSISKNRSTLPLVILSLKDSSNAIQTVYTSGLTTYRSDFIGGLYALSSINFAPTQRFIGNSDPTENVFAAPEMFLSTDTSVSAIKEIRVYIKKID